MIDSASRICIFGVGALFESCYSQIVLLLGRKPDLLSDNASAKWGRHYFGIPCVSPESLTQYDDVVVIIAVRNYENIERQLQAYGIRNISVLNFDRGYNIVSDFRMLNVPPENIQQAPAKSTLSLEGKWALVTGASRGIGYQIAQALAGLGVNILAHARVSEHCDAIVKACSAHGVQSLSVGADLAMKTSISEIDQFLTEMQIELDILVNCAGVAPRGLDNIWQQQESDYIQAFAVNTIAPVMLSSLVVPGMIERGFGRVIYVSSNIHHRPGEMAYACSKAALDKYISDMKKTLDDTDVLFSVVDPGWVNTDMGGCDAPHDVATVIPGAILGAVIDKYDHGQWFVAQDFAGMTIDAAISKAATVCSKAGFH